MGGEGAERLVVGKLAFRDVVGALPRHAGIGIILQILLIERRTHVEGVERRVVVVAEVAPGPAVHVNLRLLLAEQVHAAEHGVVVECAPVEVGGLVAYDEHLQGLALLQGSASYLLTGARQDKGLQVVGLQEGVCRQHVVVIHLHHARRLPEHVGGHGEVGRLQLRVVEVDVLQRSGIVACVGPGAESGEVSQHAQVLTRDGTYHLQPVHVAVVAAYARDVLIVVCPYRTLAIRCYRQTKLGSQRVGLRQFDRNNIIARVERVVGVDVVGILRPLRAVELAERLRHENPEVGGQITEGIVAQFGH